MLILWTNPSLQCVGFHSHHLITVGGDATSQTLDAFWATGQKTVVLAVGHHPDLFDCVPRTRHIEHSSSFLPFLYPHHAPFLSSTPKTLVWSSVPPLLPATALQIALALFRRSGTACRPHPPHTANLTAKRRSKH